LLQKTLLNIEGLGRQLYPELNLWETAKPFLERWMREQVGPRALVKALRRELPAVAPLIPELPGLIHELLRRMRDEQLVLNTRSQDLEALRQAVRHGQRRLDGLITGAGLLLGAIVLLGLARFSGTLSMPAELAAGVLAIIGAVMVGYHGLRR
jgi:ubiquinone biosynthesis protein